MVSTKRRWGTLQRTEPSHWPKCLHSNLYANFEKMVQSHPACLSAHIKIKRYLNSITFSTLPFLFLSTIVRVNEMLTLIISSVQV